MSDPYPIFGSQNLHDDDGAVIDSFFVAVDNPPDLRLGEQPITVPEVVEPVEPTRLITGYRLMTAGDRPLMVLPADARRVGLNLRAISTFATPTYNDSVFVADDQSKLGYIAGDASQARPLINTHSLDLDNHTGAVFATPGPNVQGPILLMWTATTK